ncbi:hypothetical protein Trydic_g21686 [Trypoxylus dichotomus]
MPYIARYQSGIKSSTWENRDESGRQEKAPTYLDLGRVMQIYVARIHGLFKYLPLIHHSNVATDLLSPKMELQFVFLTVDCFRSVCAVDLASLALVSLVFARLRKMMGTKCEALL